MSVSKKDDAGETSRQSSVEPKGAHLKFHGADFVITASGTVERIFPDPEAFKALGPSEALTRYIEGRSAPADGEMLQAPSSSMVNSSRSHAMNYRARIVADAKVVAGKPVIKGTRLSVDFILSLLAQGWTESEILENHPNLEREDLRAVFAFVQACLAEEEYIALGKLA